MFAQKLKIKSPFLNIISWIKCLWRSLKSEGKLLKKCDFRLWENCATIFPYLSALCNFKRWYRFSNISTWFSHRAHIALQLIFWTHQICLVCEHQKATKFGPHVQQTISRRQWNHSLFLCFVWHHSKFLEQERIHSEFE